MFLASLSVYHTSLWLEIFYIWKKPCKSQPYRAFHVLKFTSVSTSIIRRFVILVNFTVCRSIFLLRCFSLCLIGCIQGTISFMAFSISSLRCSCSLSFGLSGVSCVFRIEYFVGFSRFNLPKSVSFGIILDKLKESTTSEPFWAPANESVFSQWPLLFLLAYLSRFKTHNLRYYRMDIRTILSIIDTWQ